MKSLQLRGLKVQTWPRVFTKMLETVEGTGGALPFSSSLENRWLPAASPEGCCSPRVQPPSSGTSCSSAAVGGTCPGLLPLLQRVLREASYRQEPKASWKHPTGNAPTRAGA